ncbi:hypothetical protein STA3757_31690 [Stanieria sp. NIES-3757]|nr:hypothetical protein STA3757_31690 [Stanieria sp. NIES-3757]
MRDLKNSATQDALCCLAIEQNHQLALEIALASQYAPREPSQRALFYFLTEQWDKYESLDFEHTYLQAAFEHGNEQLRQRITEQIRKAGRAELLKVLAGGNQKKRLGAMTDAEWETTLAVLNNDKQWEEMWRLAQQAPAIWSKKLLQQLTKIKWLPQEEQGQVEFEKLAQFAQKCLKKIPPIGGLVCCKTIPLKHDYGLGG